MRAPLSHMHVTMQQYYKFTLAMTVCTFLRFFVPQLPVPWGGGYVPGEGFIRGEAWGISLLHAFLFINTALNSRKWGIRGMIGIIIIIIITSKHIIILQ